MNHPNRSCAPSIAVSSRWVGCTPLTYAASSVVTAAIALLANSSFTPSGGTRTIITPLRAGGTGARDGRVPAARRRTPCA